ncbi:hypothetical protein EVC30_053 [Rhizobium phage RHph_Y1_11]|nr:hypothetical protein EVC30_053 [Rhizobium phage RHph_Y1_11]
MKTLKQIKKDAWSAYEEGKTRAGAVAYLRKLGYERKGKGLFAIVMIHPENERYVIRCARSQSRALTDAFPWYAQAVEREWIVSKYAPKIYAVHDDGSMSVTVVERCYPLRDRKFKSKAQNTQSVLRHGALSYHFSDSELFKRGKVREFLENVSQYGALDIGGPNIMQRKNGHPVFTDPIVGD